MSSLVEARDIYRRFGPHQAVEHLSFRLQAGEVLGLLGVNGAGKSTTLRMLSGCLAPTAGEILIQGYPLCRSPLQAKAALGYLPEIPPLHPTSTVDQYLHFAARLHRVPHEDCAMAVSRAKSLCGLEGVGARPIGRLSRGYRQRVGIAQAIVHRPAVVILDEPTAGLDPVQIRDIHALIRELGEHCGVILSSHILPEVQALCQRVLILHRGRRLFLGPARGEEDLGVEATFATTPPPGALAAIPGVAAVEDLGEGRFRLTPAAGTSRPELLRRLAGTSWGLSGFAPARPDLEQVFLRLVAGEAA